MKKMIFVLAMLLTAATAYTQTSRKPANNSTAKDPKESETTQRRVTTETNHTTINANSRRSDASNANTTTRTEQTAPHRSVSRTDNNQKPQGTGTTQKPVTRENSNAERQHNNTNVTNGARGNSERGDYVKPVNTRESVDRGTGQRNIVTYESPRVYRNQHTNVAHHYHNPPATREYRSVHYIYRRPVHYEVYWTPEIHNHFIEIYPMVHRWDYYNGYRIEMISAYEAMYYRGDVKTVYGEVFEVYYERQTDEYFLYFGAYYPYHDFTVIIPGYLARRYSHHPMRYFENQCIAVTGLITTFNGEPEIVVKKSFQLSLY